MYTDTASAYAALSASRPVPGQGPRTSPVAEYVSGSEGSAGAWADYGWQGGRIMRHDMEIRDA
ncbi:hypothetical protein NKH18_02750 [Streptomyces sp. M10(2022)]